MRWSRAVFRSLVVAQYAMRKRGICRRAVSVCLSVTFVYSDETNKQIYKKFSPSADSVFPHQTSWQYSDGDPLTGALNASGVWKYRYFRPNISLHRVLSPLRPSDVINTVPWDCGKLWHSSLVAVKAAFSDGGRRRRSVYDKKPRRYAENKRTACTQWQIWSRRALEGLYYWSWQTRSIAWLLCDSRASCFTIC